MPVKKICIIGFDDYPLLSGRASPHYVGGESVQHVLLARAWRDQGLDVSMIVHDHGQPRISEVDGIRVVAAYGRSEGIPGLRFAHPRMTKFVAAMREINADAYYQSPSAADTGTTAWFCRRFGKQSIIRIASDLACIPGQQLIRYWRDRRIYEYGLRNAHLLVAQTEHQRALLLKHYQLRSEVANMAVELPHEPHDVTDIDVLWVANFRPVKRPDVVVELAKRLPHVNFTLAGGSVPGGEEYYHAMKHAAEQLPNVKCLGAVPYAEVGALFSRAKVFLNTSDMEGFPNTFLQAWVRGVPVVTFFDPDKLVQQRQLGASVKTVEEMAQSLETLIQQDVLRQRTGERARKYAITEFGAAEVARRYLQLLDGTERPCALHYGTAG
jgi:glycosyltransferase involved in cell wall biosynthesis